MKKIIFHHPQPIAMNPIKGSELRPQKMREAFESIGYEVEPVVGNSLQRKKSMNRIKKHINNGYSYDFLYAESSNMPIPISDSHHIPVRPLQDFRFFRFLNKHLIPIGLFYRDIFWQVKELKNNLPLHKQIPKQLFHWLEWYGFKVTIDQLFLPSKALMRFLPSAWDKESVSALPPGCVSNAFSKEESVSNKVESNPKLNLFYVGGVTPPLYDLTPMIELVSNSEGVQLKLCCREKEWQKNRNYYRKFDFSNIEIVHADNDEIAKYYKWSDIALCIWPQTGYINVTIPVKVIETIGYEVPVVIIEGSESAKFVKQEGIGWVVKNLNEAKILLQDLRKNREKLKGKIEKVKEVKPKHTWEARARQASDVLKQYN